MTKLPKIEKEKDQVELEAIWKTLIKREEEYKRNYESKWGFYRTDSNLKLPEIEDKHQSRFKPVPEHHQEKIQDLMAAYKIRQVRNLILPKGTFLHDYSKRKKLFSTNDNGR